DYRLISAMMRNGRLWTTANIAVDNVGSPSGTDTRMGVRWYELQGIATGQTPSVFQSGTIFQPSASNTADQRFYWMGTMMVTGQGHAVAGFSVAGSNEFVNAGIAARLVTDPLGTTQPPILYTASSTAYNPLDNNGSPIDRWGDYSYTSLDPSDDMTVWTIQEFCNAANSYGVQVVKVLAPPPAMPTNCAPATLLQGATNVNVNVTGFSTNGSGFFEPGTNFSNHITAAVNGGGVTLNSITYANPTNLTLNLTVAGNATPGTRTLSITNPDGQAVTSSTALLTIVGSSNQAPVLTAISNRTVVELSALTFTANASDPDGNAITFSLGTNSPSGATINSTNGFFAWTPSEEQGPGIYSITVFATDDGTPALFDSKTFSVTVNETNSAPVLSTISDYTIPEGSTLLITNSATDSDLPTNLLSFTIDDSPTGATIQSDTGVFSWTPGESQGPSTNVVTIRVTDNGSPALSATQTFSIVVTELNTAPVLATISNKVIYVGTQLLITNSASDADIPANILSFSLSSNAPAGTMIDSTNGLFSWIPTADQVGTDSISITVTDNGLPPLSDTKLFSVSVVAAPLLSIENQGTNFALSWPSLIS
ncbi:MAG: putative Ig domain-containing protein, partial [Verrucomicrobiota bacterium]